MTKPQEATKHYSVSKGTTTFNDNENKKTNNTDLAILNHTNIHGPQYDSW